MGGGGGMGGAGGPGANPAEPRPCLIVTAELRRGGGGGVGGGSDSGVVAVELWAPWGVQLSGNFSKSLALAAFDRARSRYAGGIGDSRPMIVGRLLAQRGTG